MAAERERDESNFFDYLRMYGENRSTVLNFVSGGGRFDPSALDKFGRTQLVVLARTFTIIPELLEFYFENGGAPNTEWHSPAQETELYEILAHCEDRQEQALMALYNAHLPQALQEVPTPVGMT